MIRLTQQARGRWSAAFHIAAGTLEAYGMTWLVTVALSLLLARAGMDRGEPVTAATLASFVIFAIIAITVFDACSAVRAWGCLFALALPVVLAAFLLSPGAHP